MHLSGYAAICELKKQTTKHVQVVVDWNQAANVWNEEVHFNASSMFALFLLAFE